jgi:serine/threonine protein phosphatase PrpC
MSTTSWRVVAASVTGASHVKTAWPCQDAHQWAELPGGILVAAVADGAGTASLGDVGAALAAGTAVETIGRALEASGWPSGNDEPRWRNLLVDALHAARTAVETQAAQQRAAVREFATTLILILAAPRLVAAAQIGDGALVLADGRGQPIALTRPQQGEYINETPFLVSPGALEQVQVAFWRGVPTHLAAFTDGLQSVALKLPEGTPHQPFFDPLFRFVESATDEEEARGKLIGFLASPRLRQRTDDDLTLLLAAQLDDSPGDLCSGGSRTASS